MLSESLRLPATIRSEIAPARARTPEGISGDTVVSTIVPGKRRVPAQLSEPAALRAIPAPASTRDDWWIAGSGPGDDDDPVGSGPGKPGAGREDVLDLASELNGFGLAAPDLFEEPGLGCSPPRRRR